MPIGLLTAAFLTRMLGPGTYGVWMLALAIVTWVEWSVASALARTAIKLVSEAEDWRAVGAAVFRASFVLGTGAAALVWVAARPLASALGEPDLCWLLRSLALDVPLFSLAQAHRNVLTGLGGFAGRAASGAGRLVVRLVLVVVLVGLGLSVAGAVLAILGASLAELLICRRYIRPRWLGPATVPWRRLWPFAAPLFLMGISLRLFEKLDLVILKTLGGTSEQAGYYGAAQNLALLPALFSLSIAPVLLSSLGQTLRSGDTASARSLARGAVRVVVLVLPLAALIAGSAPQITATVFGPRFTPAGTPLALLIFGSWAMLMVSVTSTILIAVDRVNLALALSAPLVPLALVGHLAAVPALGPPGAALVTLAGSLLAALAMLIAADRGLGVLPTLGTTARSSTAALVAATLGLLWPATGPVLFVAKLPAIGLATLAVLGALGEFRAGEITAAWALVAGRRSDPRGIRPALGILPLALQPEEPAQETPHRAGDGSAGSDGVSRCLPAVSS